MGLLVMFIVGMWLFLVMLNIGLPLLFFVFHHVFQGKAQSQKLFQPEKRIVVRKQLGAELMA